VPSTPMRSRRTIPPAADPLAPQFASQMKRKAW
jgi:hypothetical protein